MDEAMNCDFCKVPIDLTDAESDSCDYQFVENSEGELIKPWVKVTHAHCMDIKVWEYLNG